MLPSYEYLIVSNIYRTQLKEPVGERGPSERTWTSTWYLWRPNATEVEELPGDVRIGTLFNALGQEGWKLVSAQIAESVVVSGRYGWEEVAIPVRQQWTCMRAVYS